MNVYMHGKPILYSECTGPFGGGGVSGVWTNYSKSPRVLRYQWRAHKKWLSKACRGYTQPWPVLLAKHLVSLTSVREVPGMIPTGSWFFCAITHDIGYACPGMRVKCIQYTVDSLLGHAHLDFDVKQNTFTLFFTWIWCSLAHGAHGLDIRWCVFIRWGLSGTHVHGARKVKVLSQSTLQDQSDKLLIFVPACQQCQHTATKVKQHGHRCVLCVQTLTMQFEQCCWRNPPRFWLCTRLVAEGLSAWSFVALLYDFPQAQDESFLDRSWVVKSRQRGKGRKPLILF